MLPRYVSGFEVTISQEVTDAADHPTDALAASWSLIDENQALLSGPNDIAIDNPRQLRFTIEAHLNELTGNAGMRTVVIDYTTEQGAQRRIQRYVLISDTTLTPGVNSFGYFEELLLLAQSMPEQRAFLMAGEYEQQMALQRAWANIGYLPLDRQKLGVTSSSDLDAAALGSIDSRALLALRRAQIVEANFLLGGNPVEDRRRAGLISDSAGESTHYFRTSKPLVLAACREAVMELKGWLNWEVRCGR